jgi:hypothetical protein
MDSVPGVGPTLRASVLAWLPELGQLNRGEAANWSGSHRSPMTAVKFAGIGASPAAVGHCARCSLWPPWG